MHIRVCPDSLRCPSDQLNYIGHLSAAAAEMRRTDPLTGVGFDLYKMWLLANIEQNQQSIDQLAEELQLV